jgi:hypothetical protein
MAGLLKANEHRNSLLDACNIAARVNSDNQAARSRCSAASSISW